MDDKLQRRPPAKITLTVAMIEGAQSAKELLNLPALEQNWINTYSKVSGKNDGDARFNAEKILFLQTVAASQQLQQADKFSIHSAFTELAISGLTLRDGISYIVAMKGKAQFWPGWRGRLEQINEIPNVVHCHEPQVVFDCDQFDYEMGEKIKINKHKRGTRVDGTKITHVYFVIEFKHGSEVYIMEAVDVLHIRDTYSHSYKTYAAAAKAQGKEPGDKGIMAMYQGQVKNYEMEVPMWVGDEPQAFKKTIVKRVYGTLPKLPKQKWLDERLTAIAIAAGNGKEVDLEEIAKDGKEPKFDDFLDLTNETDEHGTNDTNANGAGGANGGAAVNTTGLPAANNAGGAEPITQPGNSPAAATVATAPVIIPPAAPVTVTPTLADLAKLAENTEEGF